MDLQLAGKRVLITGGSKGIGQAVAELLATEGCDLRLVARDGAALEELATALRARFQVQVETMAADLSTDATVRAVADWAGEIDILVNNAGAIPPGTLTAIDDAAWRNAWDLKVFGYISLSRAVYPTMAKRKQGVIVNVIGAAGQSLPPGYIAGATGNAALMAFTKALARGSHADGIRVVAINPGPVETKRLETMQRASAQRELGDAERWREMFKTMPFGRPAKPSEIAAAVAFLASPLSGYTSGTVLTIDGAV
jgi:NAD(P)-dependent dehydrogenase (short-subunit alcohol dehydrogenase family)